MTGAALLFVYGSLRRGARGAEALMLSNGADWIGPGSVTGHLYRIDWYPGLVLDRNAGEEVAGDLYVVNDPALLDILDTYEGCGPGDPLPHEYRRARIMVDTDQGEQEAWAYLWNKSVSGLPLIPGGDFLAHQELPQG